MQTYCVPHTYLYEMEPEDLDGLAEVLSDAGQSYGPDEAVGNAIAALLDSVRQAESE